MPFENRWGHRSVHKRFFGDMTVAEFVLSMELVQGDPRFDDLAFAINDFTEATLPPLTEADTQTFAAFGIGASYSNPKIKIAVITADPMAKTMALKYAAVAPFELKIFSTRAEMLAWLPEKNHVQLLPA